MPKVYPELRVAGTIKVEVPKKVLKLGKKGDVSLINTLTKSGKIGTHNKIPNVIMRGTTGNDSSILDQGSLQPATKSARAKMGIKKQDEVASYEEDAVAKVKALNLSEDYNARLEAELDRLLGKASTAPKQSPQLDDVYERMGEIALKLDEDVAQKQIQEIIEELDTGDDDKYWINKKEDSYLKLLESEAEMPGEEGIRGRERLIDYLAEIEVKQALERATAEIGMLSSMLGAIGAMPKAVKPKETKTVKLKKYFIKIGKRLLLDRLRSQRRGKKSSVTRAVGKPQKKEVAVPNTSLYAKDFASMKPEDLESLKNKLYNYLKSTYKQNISKSSWEDKPDPDRYMYAPGEKSSDDYRSVWNAYNRVDNYITKSKMKAK